MESHTRRMEERKGRHEGSNCHPQGFGSIALPLSPKEGEINSEAKEALKEELTKTLTAHMEDKLEATKEGWVEVVKKNIKKEAREEAQKEEVLRVHTTLEEEKIRQSLC